MRLVHADEGAEPVGQAPPVVGIPEPLRRGQPPDPLGEAASGLVLDGAWTRAVTRSAGAGSPTKKYDLTFPDLSLSIDGLENHRPFSNWVKSSALNSSTAC